MIINLNQTRTRTQDIADVVHDITHALTNVARSGKKLRRLVRRRLQ